MTLLKSFGWTSGYKEEWANASKKKKAKNATTIASLAFLTLKLMRRNTLRTQWE